MHEIIRIMGNIPMFSAYSDSELATLESCMGATVRSFSKGDVIFKSGGEAVVFGVVLSGRVQAVFHDIYGNLSIINERHIGESFAIRSLFSTPPRYSEDYISADTTRVLLVSCSKIVGSCVKECQVREKFMATLLSSVSADLNASVRKIKYLSQRTTREKLTAFLTSCMHEYGSSSFKIHFSRQELADYLCINRSALSRELCYMRDDGLLAFSGSSFELIRPEVWTAAGESGALPPEL